MKVLYVIPGIGGGGGAERSLAAMVPHWTSSIDLHIVIFSERTQLREQLECAGAQVTNLGAVSRVELFRALPRLIARLQPDLVHTTLWEADIAGRVAALVDRTPVSSSVVNVHYGREQGQSSRTLRVKIAGAQAVDALTARGVVRFHALTNHVADVMGRRLLIPRHRIEVIPRGRDERALGCRTIDRREKARHALGIGEVPLLVAAARHERQKGLDLLVRAMPRVFNALPHTRLLIGGREGSSTAQLHQLVHELHLADRIDFVGPRDDVPELMCAADAFIVPSRWEGFGSILVEAMALGVPTIATDIGPIREVAGPDPWLQLVRPEDPTNLADGIIATLTEPATANARAEKGRQRFLEGFTAERVAMRMLEFFETAVRSSRWTRSRH